MSKHRAIRRSMTRLLLSLAIGTWLLTASPAAAADYSEIIPAVDNPCGVDILLEVNFLPTDRAQIGYGDIKFTNLETDATFLQRSRYREYALFDASIESWEITVVGRKWTPWYPGEPGPTGVVQEPGLWIVTYGRLEYTVTTEDVATAFTLEGTYTDVCAQLTA